MKKLISFLILIFLIINTVNANYYYQYKEPHAFQQKLLTFGDNQCENIKEYEIPTIFIPGILASWYSEYGYDEAKVKRWIPDPITHSYDTLFYTFQKNNYKLKDVFYEDGYNLKIEGNPKQSLYLFGYDWKKDNKITATLLNQLISKIREDYILKNGCDIGKVNIIAHSMGGLVARSMLEDMCVNDEELNIYKKNKQVNGKIMSFTSTKCKDQTKINKFITISTPHRGSPRSLPMWEKGAISTVEKFFVGTPLKTQFGNITDQGLYETIHGYRKKVPNGIVTIGQLLPDIAKENKSNINFQYLQKKDYFISQQSYPKNSFLEELNKTNNINKMWEKIDNKYISYYSILTGNAEKNNIIGFELKYSTEVYSDDLGKNEHFENDVTQDIVGRDIYANYKINPNGLEYHIRENIRDEKGFGGDGTVPTYNLILVPNDSQDGIQIKNTKFESREIKCYDDKILLELGKDDLDEIENRLYKNIGKKDKIIDILGQQKLSACSHTKTPISNVIQVYLEISGNDIINEKDEDKKIEKERKLLLEYIGNADYTIYKNDYNYTTTQKYGILNTQVIGDLFEDDQYKKVLNDKKIKKDTKDDPVYVPLSFGGEIGKLLRYEVLSPINITITDQNGNKIGINHETGLIENAIAGAWTSGDTEGSGEPEFFLIPVTGTGEIQHNIQTYGTGDGEYHIVMEEIDLQENNIEENKELIIKGTARNNFGEDYLINIGEEKTEFTNLTENINTTLEINKMEVKIQEDNYKVKYTIRGQSKDVEKIKYILYKGDKKIIEKEEKINGEIDIILPENGNYILQIELMNNEGKTLSNATSKKEIKIEKVKKIEKFLKDNTSIENNNSFLDEDLLEKLNENKSEKLLEINTKNSNFKIDFFTNTGSLLTSTLGYSLNHSFDYRFYYNIHSKQVDVILPNEKSNIFEYNSNFEYEAKKENTLYVLEQVKDIKIIDNDENIEYIFDKESFKLLKISNISNNHEIELYYNLYGNLDYVTDNNTNIYFFKYDKDNKLIKSINDIYENEVIFEYLKIGDFELIETINSREFDVKLWLNNEGNLNLLGENEIIFESSNRNIIYDIEDNIVMNNNFSVVKYTEGLDGNLYSFYKNKIYKINLKNGKKELILKNKSDIWNIFVSKNGDLYYYDGVLNVFDNSPKTKELIGKDIEYNISDFIVFEENIYFLDKFKKGYFYFDIKSGVIKHFNKKEYIRNIGLKGDEIIFIKDLDGLEQLHKNPEFEIKYQSKLIKIKSKIKNKFSKIQRENLKKVFVSGREGFLCKINSEYKKLELEYLINEIINIL